MLHILLLILKIIGILLAVILGLVLLVIGIVLFVPVCYRAEAKSSGTVEDVTARGRISWLFGLVRVVVEVKGKAADFDVKIAWKSLRNSKKPMEEREDTVCEEDDADQKEWKQQEYVEDTDTEKTVEEVEEPEPHTQSAPESVEKISAGSTAADPRISEESDENISGSEKIQNKFHSITSGIKKLFEKIKCTFRDFCDKIKEILGKKDRLAAFIKDETHLGAFRKGKQEVFKLLRRLTPKVLAADIHYGFEDPCLTGQVLAVLGALYPLIGEHTEITPDFQKKVLEGRLKIRGRIYVVHLAILAVNMLLCREVRQTIKDIRNFKL